MAPPVSPAEAGAAASRDWAAAVWPEAAARCNGREPCANIQNSMYTYIHLSLSTYLSIYTYIHTYIHGYIYAHIHTLIHSYVRTYTHA